MDFPEQSCNAGLDFEVRGEGNKFLPYFMHCYLGSLLDSSKHESSVWEGNRCQPQGVIGEYLMKVEMSLDKLTRDGEASHG